MLATKSAELSHLELGIDDEVSSVSKGSLQERPSSKKHLKTLLTVCAVTAGCSIAAHVGSYPKSSDETAVRGRVLNEQVQDELVSSASIVGNSKKVLELRAPDAEPLDLFSSSVAVNNHMAIVGAKLDTNEQGFNVGAVYVYDKKLGKLEFREKLIPTDGQPGDCFGTSVAMNTEFVFVGAAAVLAAPLSEFEGFGPSTMVGLPQGAVYTYISLLGRGFLKTAKLSASDGKPADMFGFDVAATDDWLIVGAPGRSDQRGAAYIFKRSGAAWIEMQILDDAQIEEGTNMGSSVAIHGDFAIVGVGNIFDLTLPVSSITQGSGKAFVYKLVGDTWALHQVLLPPEGAFWFGASVSIYNGLAAVGAPGDANVAFQSGLIGAPKDLGVLGRVFLHSIPPMSGVNATIKQELVLPTPRRAILFGFQVELSAERLLVTAPLVDGLGFTYRREPTSNKWVVDEILQAPEVSTGIAAGVSAVGRALGGRAALAADGTVLLGAVLGRILSGEAWLFSGEY